MNPYFLSDIKCFHQKMAMCFLTNGGNLYYKQSGTTDMFPLIFLYYPYSIAKILTLVDVRSQFRFTMGTKNEPSTFIHTDHIPYSSFTSATKDCTILILLPLMHLIVTLMPNLSLLQYKRTRKVSFIQN